MNITQKNVEDALTRLRMTMPETPLQYCERLSDLYNAEVYLKREDLTRVRSFKIRGAYNKMTQLTASQKKHGVVCASAGNHAQGVALSCSMLRVAGTVFMPVTTPLQKIDKVKYFGGKFVDVKLVGRTFDEASAAATDFCKKQKATYVHPFDDEQVMIGQATVAAEIVAQLRSLGLVPEAVLATVGGGGLLAGTIGYMQATGVKAKLYGCEPQGADSLNHALSAGKPVTLPKIDTFVDGAAVATVGAKTFEVIHKYSPTIEVVAPGAVCAAMIDLYQSEGIIAEPAGALTVAALDKIKNKIKGKVVVCIVSGGNNDLMRYPEIQEKSLVYRGLKHYFVIEFAQRPGSLREFLNKALGSGDDIVLFEYLKRTNKERGSALVGIELKSSADLDPLLGNLSKLGINYKKITSDDLVFNLLI